MTFPSLPPVRIALACAAWLALLPAAQAAPAGTVAFLQGDATIRAAQGALRPAAAGAVVESGDTVQTGRGRLQLHMADGAYISLQPETALRLDDYRVASATEPEQGLMSLLRGGLRTITGAIGRANRQAYRLTTPTATVGIRGTEFLATADEGTRVRVAGGEIALCNGSGCVNVASGQSGFAPPGGAAPLLVSVAPSLPPEPAPANDPVYLAAEQRNARGESVVFGASASAQSWTTPLPPGPGDASVFYSYASGGTGGGILGGSMSYDAGGGLVSYTDCCSGPAFTGGTLAESGADGLIAWGRWSAGLYGSSALGSLQYVTSSTTQASSMPVVRGYASFASTAPVLSSSSGATLAVGTSNSVTGTLNVNFTGSSGGTVSYALSVPLAGETFSINGSAAQYGTTKFLGTSSSISSTGAGCSSACAGVIPFADAFQGFITGPAGERAGGTYGFSAPGLGGTVSGAIVFK